MQAIELPYDAGRSSQTETVAWPFTEKAPVPGASRMSEVQERNSLESFQII